MLQQRALRACQEHSERDIAALVGPGLVKCQFIGTESGFLGLAPSSQESDSVCIIYGTKTPYVVRYVGGELEGYTLVGGCYVMGAMDREVVEACDQGINYAEGNVILV